MSIKHSRLALLGVIAATGSLLAMSALPLSQTLAANPPHLVIAGPTGSLKVGANAAISAHVAGATGTPMYQFRDGARVIQRYSTNNHLTLDHLKQGQYTITVRSLGVGQERRGAWHAFRSAELHFTVSSPHLTVAGPVNGVAKNGTATVTARVMDVLVAPYYQFVLDGKTVQAFSTKNTYTATHLSPGTYHLLVESLGPAQYRNHEDYAARKQQLTLIVPTPPVKAQLTVTGPTNDVAKNGQATITAQVIHATTAAPYFQFEINGSVVQAFSTKDTYTAKNLKPGTYQVLVESLGPAQYQRGQSQLARKQSLTLTVPTEAGPATVTAAEADVARGTSDTLTVSGVPQSAPVTWSVVSSNHATGLVSGTTDTATFVGTAAGTYTVQASVDSETATTKVVVYGQAAQVTLTPASSKVIADGEATDAVTVNVVDQNGNLVGNFNGSVDLNAMSRVTYSQNGTPLTPSNGQIRVMVTDGTATVEVGQVSVPGISIALTTRALSSSNGQTIASTPQYGSTTITSAAQTATSLKIVNAPTYLAANTQGTKTAPIAVMVEDQAGYPMLSGTDSIKVSVSGPAGLVNSSDDQATLAYDGGAAPAGKTNTSASFALASQQSKTGTVTITATSAGLTPATATVQSVIAGVPSQITASLSANSFAEGSSGVTLNLQAQDSQGAPVNYTSPVSIVVTRQGATTPASNILVNGQADSRATQLSLNASGSAAVSISDSGHGTNAGTYTITVTPVSGAQYRFASKTLTVTETAAALAKAAFTSPSSTTTVPITDPKAQYTLQLEDAYGNPVSQSGVKVELYAVGSSSHNASYGQATINGTAATSSSPITVTTNSQGQVTATLAAESFQGADWVLHATIPEQSGVTAALQSAPSATMEVSSTVAKSLTVSLQDESQGTDYHSSGYALAGNTVDATVTVKNQYGAAMTGSQTVVLKSPAGLSGIEPKGASDRSTWTPGATNTISLTVNLNSKGTATIPFDAWTEGSATLQASVPGVGSQVTGQAAIVIQAGPANSVGLFQNGTLIDSSTPLIVKANSPAALTVNSTDIAGNPVPATGSEVVTLTQSQGGSFRLSPTGAAISMVTIPDGQTSVTVYYVNATAGSYAPTASLAANQLSLVGPSTYTVSPGATQSINVLVADSSGKPVAGQDVTASVSNKNGSVTPSATSGSKGTASFTYTAPTSGSGTATVALAVPGQGASGSSLTQTVTIHY